MKYINLKELRELQSTPLSLSQLAKHYGVNLFDLNNFIYSHEGRNGTYPVDGTRSRAPIKTANLYPSKLALTNKLKHKSIAVVAVELGVSYSALYRYIKKIGIKI